MKPRFFPPLAGSVTMAVLALAISWGVAGMIRGASVPSPTVAAVTADVGLGKHLFLTNCAHCHGDDARGDEGPDLHNLHKSDGRIHQVVQEGIKGEMPAFGKKLSDADVGAITAFLRTLN